MNFRADTAPEESTRQEKGARRVLQEEKSARGQRKVLKDDQDWLRVGSEREAEIQSKTSDDDQQHAARRNMRNPNRFKTSPKELLGSAGASQEMVSENELNYAGVHRAQHVSGCEPPPLAPAAAISNNPNSTQRIVKRHLPHCIHNHSRNCPKHQQLQKLTVPVTEEELESEARMAASNSATVVRRNTTYRQLKYYKHQPDKYLLVEYRPSAEEEFHLSANRLSGGGAEKLSRCNNQDSESKQPPDENTGKRNTIKFISQLYFLLHLSAILSLLLHHKNLLASERRLLAKQSFMQQANFGARPHVRKHSATGGRVHAPAPSERQSVVLVPPPAPAFDLLPEPQKLLGLAHKQAPSSNMLPVVGSVIVSSTAFSPSDHTTGNATRSRFGRQAEQEAFGLPAGGGRFHSRDILVELVGHWHAKCALQYFLCYLLSSSVAILVCIRLCRMCCLGGKRTLNHEQAAAPNWPSLANYGFYYRTRLDCTPVLIGSISLGLIQLIVIGLEVANNIDWLSGDGRRWPIYLPALQFGFVSLLMQFILSKVAKNHEQKESGVQVDLVAFGQQQQRRGFQAKRRRAFSISQQQQAARGFGAARQKGAGLFENNASGLQVETRNRPASWWRLSNGFHNIALAHLLVTHILLWLMKLNSISLFQSIEHQWPLEQLTVNNNLLLAQDSQLLDSEQANNSQFAASDTSPGFNFVPDNSPPNEPPTNRTELEAILRPKSQTGHNVTSGAETMNANHPAGNQQKRSELQPPPALSPKLAERAPPDNNKPLEVDPGAKNERGMRSASVKSTSLSDQNEPEPFPAADNTTISMSHGQLMRLLSMAASGQTRLAPPTRPNATSVVPIVQPNTFFKSSLPKRMTAFRQASARQPAAARPQPSDSFTGPTSGSSNPSQTVAASSTTTVAPKQRARIIISHEPELSSHRQLGKSPASGTNGVAFQERPFPSMELATQAAREKAATVARNQDHEHGRPKASSGLERPIQVVRGKPLGLNNDTKEAPPAAQVKLTPLSPPPAIVENEVDSESEEVDSEGESGQDDDDESAFQLPPVPNYNDTGAEDAPSSSPAPAGSENQQEFPIMRRPRILKADARNATEELKEQALVFNEAASAVEPSVTKAPVITNSGIGNGTGNKTNQQEKNNASLPEPQAQQRKQPESLAREQPSFADYLLPIVHQYHILIIAILFNMWLDSLRKGTKPMGPRGRLARSSRRPEASASSSSSDFSSEHKFPIRAGRATSRRLQQVHRSRSANSLHRHEDRDSSGSTLSRYNSLRSSSSQRQLLWIPSSHLKTKRQQPAASGGLQKWEMPPFTSMTFQRRNCQPELSDAGNNRRTSAPLDQEPAGTHPVCSVFFGLLVVSGSLIVMILGIDLLSVLAQCAAQFISILVCFLGLCFIWKFSTSTGRGNRRRMGIPSEQCKNISKVAQPNTESHRQCFHYLFLLAAYYCGISIALNLTSQYSIEHLFSQQVIQFGQRYLNQWTSSQWFARQHNQEGYNQQNSQANNYLPLFHVILALKGLLLILQVTLQTILIRSSCQRATRDLRQIYTFLMFANLSLWAMEICEQQQHLQRDVLELDPWDKTSKLMTLDSFTRFAASIVTLSHLYHGLVFMQH